MIDIPDEIRAAVVPPARVDEDTRVAVEAAKSKALAGLIMRYINEHEPLLKAQLAIGGTGAELIVEERGGGSRFFVGVTPSFPKEG